MSCLVCFTFTLLYSFIRSSDLFIERSETKAYTQLLPFTWHTPYYPNLCVLPSKRIKIRPGPTTKAQIPGNKRAPEMKWNKRWKNICGAGNIPGRVVLCKKKLILFRQKNSACESESEWRTFTDDSNGNDDDVAGSLFTRESFLLAPVLLSMPLVWFNNRNPKEKLSWKRCWCWMIREFPPREGTPSESLKRELEALAKVRGKENCPSPYSYSASHTFSWKGNESCKGPNQQKSSIFPKESFSFPGTFSELNM